MSDNTIKPFLCENMDKSLVRGEWERWLRSLELYLASEEIIDIPKKRNKLLHLGGTQLPYNLPGAIETYDPKGDKDVYKALTDKLTEYFSPKQNSTFERHVFRHLKPDDGECLNKFLLKVRHQAAKCDFGSTAEDAKQINIKDKLIDAWASIELKKKLLERERTLEETIELCQVHEQISTQTVAGASREFTVNKLKFNSTRSKHCTRCGKLGHSGIAQDCPARYAKCHKCSYQGHFGLMCRTTSKAFPQGRDGKRFSSSTALQENRNKRRRVGARSYAYFRNNFGKPERYSNRRSRRKTEKRFMEPKG
nr:unnamed protein product [Callosobruchus analis]